MSPLMKATSPRTAGRIAQAEAKFAATVLEVNDGNPEAMKVVSMLIEAGQFKAIYEAKRRCFRGKKLLKLLKECGNNIDRMISVLLSKTGRVQWSLF